MPDPRFFESLGPVTLGDLAALTGSVLADPSLANRQIQRVSILARAQSDDVTFMVDRRQAAALQVASAGACFLTEAAAADAPVGCAALITAWPQTAYAAAARRLHRPWGPGTERIAADALIEDGAMLSVGVVVGSGAQIGRGTRIGPNTVIGPGVAIGRDCDVGANVSIGFSLIGDRVRILSGAVIGEAGFGAVAGPKGVVDLPQLGRVILQDGVTVGANSCIDRGAYEDTIVGENTKIDNLVQIAHNVKIGRNCVMAAHTGISGSVDIGDGAQFGGRAGVADHLSIGDGARIAAASGLMHNVPAGETWGGLPAQPIKQWMRETAWLRRQSARRQGGEDA